MVANLAEENEGDPITCLSVPFSSGQWLLLIKAVYSASNWNPFSPLFVGAMVANIGNRTDCGNLDAPFSPLFVGAMVATNSEGYNGYKSSLSVPFSSGQWLLRFTEPITVRLYVWLSVPFSSGQWLLRNYF